MAIYQSKDLLDHLHQQCEIHLETAIKNWQNLSPDLLNQSPATGSWSAAQCIEHLNFYFRYYLPAIEKGISKAMISKTKSVDQFKTGWLGDYFTKLMQPNVDGSLKKKMKAPANSKPEAIPDASKVVAEFIDHQEKLQFLLNQAAFVNINTIRIPISIARFIKLKLGDVFMFIIAHNERHMLQAQKALEVKGSVQFAI